MPEPTTEAERRLFARVADLNRERIPDLCPLGTTPGSGTDADSFRVGDLRELEAVVRQLRRELADLDNPGNLELILDHKKLCYSECKTWCERCIGDTARRLVKACLGLRAKIAERHCPYDPELDGTDGACPAWWRGDAHGAEQICKEVTKILHGQDDGSGVAGEPWESVRRRLLGLWAKVAEQTVQVECLEKTLTHNQGILTAMGKLQDEQAERIKGLEAQIATQRAEIHTLQHDLLPAVEAFAEKVLPKPSRQQLEAAERLCDLNIPGMTPDWANASIPCIRDLWTLAVAWMNSHDIKPFTPPPGDRP